MQLPHNTMKKQISLIIFVGLAINAIGQEVPNNLKEAMDAAKNHWMMGDWERERSNGTTEILSFKWAVKDSVVSVQTKRDGEIYTQGLIGIDSESNKVVGKMMGRRGSASSEWLILEGKLFENIRGSWKNADGQIQSFSFARHYREIDKDIMEASMHRLNDDGEVGELIETPNGNKMIRTFNRKPRSTQSAVSAEEAKKIIEEITQLTKKWSIVHTTKDWDFLKRIWADDFSYTMPGGIVFDKKNGLVNIEEESDTLTSASCVAFKARVYSKNLVIGNGDHHEAGKDKDGTPFSRKFRFTNVWVRKSGKWQVVRGHASLLE